MHYSTWFQRHAIRFPGDSWQSGKVDQRLFKFRRDSPIRHQSHTACFPRDAQDVFQQSGHDWSHHGHSHLWPQSQHSHTKKGSSFLRQRRLSMLISGLYAYSSYGVYCIFESVIARRSPTEILRKLLVNGVNA